MNEYESKIVEDAFLMYSQGYKAVAIADKFKECGCRRKNGKLVDHKYLYFILHNKRYTGVVEHQGELYDNIFPRIISNELWNKVNAINEENKLAPSRKKRFSTISFRANLYAEIASTKWAVKAGLLIQVRFITTIFVFPNGASVQSAI